MKALLIVGLPASGKSHFLREIKTQDDVVIDDFISSHIPKVESLILTDPYLCVQRIRDAVEGSLTDLGYTRISFIYYENDPDQCLKNATTRPEMAVDNLIRHLSKSYNPPRIDRRVYGKEV